jgi:hypothetical protein
MDRAPRNGRALLRVAGWCRLSLWVVLLWAVSAPWQDLGGLVHERLRWLQSVALYAVAPAGFTVGQLARDVALSSPRWTHARLLRYVGYPPLAATALVMGALELLDRPDAAGVVLTGTLAYLAGLDTALAAWPLARGQDYGFARPLRREETDRSPAGW